MTLKALVVEDSRLAREGLLRMLAVHPELEIVGQAENAEAALALITAHRPEVLFLDIHLPGDTGFELLARLDYLPRVIFTTAYADYAIRSFEHDTVDYLLKPISAERLARAASKLIQLAPEPSAAEPLPLAWDSRIFIKDGETCHLVAISAIRSIDSCKNYVQIFFAGERGAQSAYVKRSLDSVEQRLPPGRFFRANRQTLVNLQSVTRIEETMKDGFVLTLDDGRRVEISRRNAAQLRERLSL
jgi:two-component system LytT family response regulator